MNLLLFPIEHQNPGHQKTIQHTLQQYCVESPATLASINLCWNAMKWQMEATCLRGKRTYICVWTSDDCYKLSLRSCRRTVHEEFKLFANSSFK